MNVKHLILIIILVSYYQTNAQKIYTTEEGHIMMMTLVDDKPFKAESHKLALYLDYESKVVSGVLDLKTLSTDIPEINSILQEQENPLILRFTGTIPSQDFLSKRHDPIDFNWPLDIKFQGRTFKSQFKATITHIEQGISMSCLISATGQVLLADTGMASLIQGLDKTIQVQFAQLVLKLE
ncbi:hypothetical protein SAMN04487764_0312 [Gillisia sp. Hel1_33_143]|uniref:hypothetical protein n=1 Tax=unclassified Gillisia TaxID=2615025 RepID=UPI000553BDAC|nr:MULTISPECIES: hypothetical protein [unclassified Gillisia]SDR69827.1 hypothetical protein SAMN04487764_0312 [Gillisia sp. Hel1_33_143]HEA31424.1 hypothetical protein [Leeuwenhoekiella sp.]